MNKSTIKTAFVTALVLVVGVICIFSFHNSFTDRLNPFISQETSYAQVDKGTQRYYNVKAYNPKTKNVEKGWRLRSIRPIYFNSTQGAIR